MAAPMLSYEDLGLLQGAGWRFRHLDLHIRERDRPAEAIRYALSSGVLDAFTIGAESRKDQDDLTQKIAAA